MTSLDKLEFLLMSFEVKLVDFGGAIFELIPLLEKSQLAQVLTH